MMSPQSTGEVARLLGIARSTLEVWIQQGKVRPRAMRVGRKTYRVWTEREIEKVRRVKKKTYRKGRGRKKEVKS